MMSPVTPVSDFPQLSRWLGLRLLVKRDDLYPVPGGGNKGRKLRKILDPDSIANHDSIVTTGGTQSNHARVAALAAAQRCWPCHLVLHGQPDELENPQGNLLLALLAGAQVQVRPPEQIAASIDDAVGRLRAAGHRPLVIPGGGHCLAGALAYADAVDEMIQQCPHGWRPDAIVLASGTGTTQAGIQAGLDRHGIACRTIGISVARSNPRGIEAVTSAYREICEHLDLPIRFDSLDFRDRWIDGGYQQASNVTWDVVHNVAQRSGLILDPTYTGKAFRGLCDLAAQGELAPGSHVLFWHTGGLLNLQAMHRPIKLREVA